MKKLFTYTLICVFAVSLFTSCSSKFTFAKRQHSRGYYIDFGNKKTDAPTAKEETKEVRSVPVTSTLQNKTEQDTAIALTEKKVVAENPVLIAKTEQKKSSVDKKQKTTFALTQVTPVKKIKQLLAEKKKVNNTTDDGDGLSLFWLVILILIILWAIGALGGGFGLGSFIHVLLVIALILLILWLLRVI